MKRWLLLLLVACGCRVSGGCTGDSDGEGWLRDARILVPGVGVQESDCRTKVCPHNENTDLLAFGGALYLVHRTAQSQVLGPNSSLRVYRSMDGGESFALLAIIPAPTAATYPELGDRDLRDPQIYVVDGQLAIKALVRLPVVSLRDSDVDTRTVLTTSPDGVQWTPLTPMAPATWSFWHIRQQGGVYYTAAYEDGDKRIALFTSSDGRTWTRGATVYDVADDTPLEPEVIFTPAGRLLVLVRLDGSAEEILGNVGRLRTRACWAPPPYAQFDCAQTLDGVRLDGPNAFWRGDRLFVVARKHFFETADRKRTALYELPGAAAGGPLSVIERGELPSAGDTAYAGVAPLDDRPEGRVLVTWYSGDREVDAPWLLAVLEASDIWRAVIDVEAL